MCAATSQFSEHYDASLDVAAGIASLTNAAAHLLTFW
jgi:hypothetical protein